MGICHIVRNFRVGPSTEQYPLNISGYDGVTSDPFSKLNTMRFTTRDKDNDQWGGNCAVEGAGGYPGGWWYRACFHISLNNQY